MRLWAKKLLEQKEGTALASLDAKARKEAIGKELQVLTPPPFTWMTTGSVAFGGMGAPALSTAAPVNHGSVS